MRFEFIHITLYQINNKKVQKKQLATYLNVFNCFFVNKYKSKEAKTWQGTTKQLLSVIQNSWLIFSKEDNLV